MNRLAIAVSLILAFQLSLAAQDKTANVDAVSPDAPAVRATVTNYIEAYYTGDATRMEQTLDPHYLKHMIHGTIPMREWTGAQMVASVRAEGPANLPASEKTEQVTVLDVAGNLASAKLVTPGWTDYMTLEKINGEWKILSVVQRID